MLAGLSDSTPNTFKKAAAEKSVCLDALFGHWDKNKIKEALNAKYEELEVEFALPKTREKQLNRAVLLINRYVQSEIDRRRKPEIGDAKIFDLKGLSSLVSIKPDLIFETKDYIECVIIKTGKAPSNFAHTSTKKRADTSPESSLLFYSLFNYARALLVPGEQKVCKASVYYLRGKDDFSTKNSDSGKDLTYASFFDDSSCIYTLEDPIPIKRDNDGKYTVSYIDIMFQPYLEEFEKGIDASECTEEECQYCPSRAACKFKFAPIVKVKERKTKSLGQLKLTAPQKKVIDFDEGFGRCNAGAGAGKTLVTALRVIKLLQNGVKPEEILLITFSKAGAMEMYDRVAAYLVDECMDDEIDVEKIKIATFNAFCNDIITKEYAEFGFTAAPRVIQEIERIAIIRAVSDKYTFDGLDYANFISAVAYPNAPSGLDVIVKAFDVIKSNRLSIGDDDEFRKLMPPTYLSRVSLTAIPQLLAAYDEYDKLMKTNNLIEYADQEILFFDLLAKKPDYLEQFNYKHIIVDEFQDTSLGQINIIKEIVDCPAFKSLLVVGDDSQSIYGFRGTSPEHIINFFDELDVPEDARNDFYLVDNHRCTPAIIDLANKMNARRKEKIDKDLVASRVLGKTPNKPVEVQAFYDTESEYDYIVEGIKNHIANGTRPEDIAFLGADKTVIDVVASKLAEAGIPAIKMNPELVLDNSKVLAGIDLAKAIENPQNSKSAFIYLNAKWENKLVELSTAEINSELEDFTRHLEAVNKMPENKKIEEFFTMLEDIDFDEDELYEDFVNSVKLRPTFKKQLEYIKMLETYGQKQTYTRERSYPGVVLTTMHSSKGLEWPIVYMSVNKVDEESFHRSNLKGLEEKRRLVFVSMTRARDELYITGQYKIGRTSTNNQFLANIYEDLGKKDCYCPIDPNAEVKKTQRELERKIKAAERLEEKKAILKEAAETTTTYATEVKNTKVLKEA